MDITSSISKKSSNQGWPYLFEAGPERTNEAKKRLETKRAKDRKSYQRNIEKRRAYDRERYARKKALSD